MDRQQAQKLLCEPAGAKAALDQEEPQSSKIAVTADNKMILATSRQAYLSTGVPKEFWPPVFYASREEMIAAATTLKVHQQPAGLAVPLYPRCLGGPAPCPIPGRKSAGHPLQAD